MTDRRAPDFETFARAFVREYWETVKSGRFSMPQDEPVEETLDELLADVTLTTELERAGSSRPTHVMRMTATSGDWWEFRFHEDVTGWALAGCITPGLDKAHPDDLLAPPYDTYFVPFLQHVTAAANDS